MQQVSAVEASPPAAPRGRAAALRVLALDALERAGAPVAGVPLGMAEVLEVLFTRHLRHDPARPGWWDRDRFVLSDGRGAPLLYALLHLAGYDLPRAELERFRRLGSLTPGHPDHGLTPGVEATTGPAGQGLAQAVGLALAERLLAADLNRPGLPVVDHFTYALVGDACLMEGLSHEVAPLAAALHLGKLVCLWDEGGGAPEGEGTGEDTAARFEAYGWHVVREVDAHDADDVSAALALARSDRRRPSLVCCRADAGRGLPPASGNGAGAARALREALGFGAAPFELPAEVCAAWDVRGRGAALRAEWEAVHDAYARAHPALAAELRRRMSGDLPVAYPRAMARALEEVAARREVVATRRASQDALALLARTLPELAGGAADLTGATLARLGDAAPAGREGGRHVRWGARELGMCAATTGLALHGGVLPFAATFLASADSARGAIRLAALSGVRAVFVLTHDSVAVGEDGPAHQPVEHAATLRLVPGLDVWRPCDALETFAAWRAAVERRDGPTALLLSRAPLPPQARDRAALRGVARGGYVLAEAAGGAPRAVLVATGAEVQLAMAARRRLAEAGIAVRVVSMPSTSVFDRQDPEWRAAVLPPNVPRVAVEAGASAFWRKYVGLEGAVVGVDRFGESAPMPELLEELGLTPERVARVVRSVARRRGRRVAAARHQAH